jgi:cell division protein FtsW
MHRKSAYILCVAVLCLVAIGAVMLFSTGAFAADAKGDPLHFIKRQVVWIGIGLVACAVAMVIDYHFWARTWWIWFGVAVVLLALCYVPPIGLRINGSNRWVGLGGFRMQPSELAKLAAVFFLAWWFTKYEKASGKLLHGFAIPLATVGVLLVLIVFEVDLGTTALIGATAFVIMFIAGTNPVMLGGLSLVGLAGTVFVATMLPQRMGRLQAFMDPERYKEGAGLQQMQALIAWGSGGIEGLGLGQGRQKMLYLPFAHTDFIFPIIGEELGLRVSLLVVFLFVVIIVCGMIIALHACDRFGLLLASGIVALLSLQAAVNIGVTTSLLPNKGLSLPFISYGGSNLIVYMFAIGILLSIYRQGVFDTRNTRRAVLQAHTRHTPRI